MFRSYVMISKYTPHWFVVVLVVVAGIASWGQGRSDKRDLASPDAQVVASQVAKPTGSSRCQFCHAAEVEGYARSAMAHSVRRAGREPDGTVETPDAKITMYSSPTGYWQRLQSGEDVTNYRIDYVIGSGNHASGYLLDLSGHLFQSPVAYYKSRQAYDLAPGYEGLPNPDFTRPVAEACLFCHSGTALHISGTSNGYRSPAKSGTDRFHGSASDYFNYEKMFASQHFVGYPYLPFHSNNMDFAIGGPVIPHHGFYFYFAVEPLRSSASSGGSVNFAAPQFIQFAQSTPALAKTVGTGLVST